jgi:hypothetical protein
MQGLRRANVSVEGQFGFDLLGNSPSVIYLGTQLLYQWRNTCMVTSIREVVACVLWEEGWGIIAKPHLTIAYPTAIIQAH